MSEEVLTPHRYEPCTETHIVSDWRGPHCSICNLDPDDPIHAITDEEPAASAA